MKVHFIAIGGSAMHNLALALNNKGYEVTGSDDEIFEPSKTRLQKAGILPSENGWFPDKITASLDAVILGMHARQGNPELEKAQDLGIPIFSYPEYIYEQCKAKKRIVIGGSHGKTSITAMILHVLDQCAIDTDYMVGAQLEGFDTMVRLTEDAPIVILEGDEYLSSPIDRRPKFHLYRPHIGLISGISWDHINVFPTFENYVEQFRIFVSLVEPDGTMIYCEEDNEVVSMVQQCDEDLNYIPYGIPSNENRAGVTFLTTEGGDVPLEVFGNHNLMNLEGARNVCNQIGVTHEQFYKAISSFKGASKRLELIAKGTSTNVYKDFAHSPSKLKATTAAVKEQFTDRKLVACMELHTFSSLNSEFLKEYNGSMDTADQAIVYFSPEALKHKQLPDISLEQVKAAFNRKDLVVYQESDRLLDHLNSVDWSDTNLLIMSSGNFGGLNLNELGTNLVGNS